MLPLFLIRYIGPGLYQHVRYFFCYSSLEPWLSVNWSPTPRPGLSQKRHSALFVPSPPSVEKRRLKKSTLNSIALLIVLIIIIVTVGVAQLLLDPMVENKRKKSMLNAKTEWFYNILFKKVKWKLISHYQRFLVQ